MKFYDNFEDVEKWIWYKFGKRDEMSIHWFFERIPIPSILGWDASQWNKHVNYEYYNDITYRMKIYKNQFHLIPLNSLLPNITHDAAIGLIIISSVE